MNGHFTKLNRRLYTVLIFLICTCCIISPVLAMRNPAAVYCSAMGYEYLTWTDSEGGQAAMCQMPSGQVVDAWKFLQGKVSPEYSYCAKQGLQQKTVASPATCIAFNMQSCAVCVENDGSETEVTKLMNLSFQETTCGDGSCGFPENPRSCPADCPQSGADGICQDTLDFRCDPDCIDGKGDTDCMYLGNPLMMVTAVLVILVIIGGIGWFIWSRRKT